MNSSERITKGQRVSLKSNSRKTGTATCDEFTSAYDSNIQAVNVIWDGGKRPTGNLVRNLTVIK